MFVGVSQFEDSRFADVPFAADDAVDLAHLFCFELGLIRPEKAVIALAGEPRKPESIERLRALLAAGTRRISARQADVYSQLETQARISAAPGLLLVTFSTHGYSDQGADYLMATDSLIRRAVRTGIAVHEVFDDVARARAPRRLVFLDACRERLSKGTRSIVPALESAMSKGFAAAIAKATGQVVLAGAPLGGFAYDDSERGNGVFTAAIIDGLRGAAPADETGLITVRALADFVEQRVAEWIRDFRPEHGEPSGGLARRIEGPAEGLPLAIAPGFLQVSRLAAGGGDENGGAAASTAGEAISRSGWRRGWPRRVWAGVALGVVLVGGLVVWRMLFETRQRPVDDGRSALESRSSAAAPKPPPSTRADAAVAQRSRGADEGAGRSEQGPLGTRWHLVPGGVYQIGSPPEESGRDLDETLHRVTLTHGIWVSETEVTQEQWRQLSRTTPARFRGCGEKCPVESINWYEAVAFANLFSDHAGVERCYTAVGCKGQLGAGCGASRSECTGNYVCATVSFKGSHCRGYRLATESEWEVAARSGEERAIYTGALTLGGGSVGPELDPIAWYAQNSVVSYQDGAPCEGREGVAPGRSESCGTQVVAQKRPNASGLYDMLGNVWEWVWDHYGPYPAGDVIDPVGSTVDPRRVARGGSWDGNPRNCRSATRYWYAPSRRVDRVGLRLVRSQIEEPEIP